MSVEIVSGKLIAANAVATNVECGFVPSHIQLIKDLGGTEKHYKFMRVLYDEAVAGTGKYGYDIVDSPVPLTDADNGFIPYDESVESVVLPAPDGDGYMKAPTIVDYLNGLTPTARTITALGTVYRPSTHNGFVYECTATAGVLATEPTWPTKVGDTITDDNNTFICREERVVRTGVQGFTIGATLSVDGQYWWFKAEKHDRHTFMGDADVENPVTFGDHMR